MLMDKSTLEEQQAAYLGMYEGRLMDESVRRFVESCDRVLAIGTIMTDFNTGAFTAHLDPEKTIDVGHHRTRVGSKVYPNVEIKDLLAELTGRVAKRVTGRGFSLFRSGRRRERAMSRLRPSADPRWERFLKPNDILITETGTCSLGLAACVMPRRRHLS